MWNRVEKIPSHWLVDKRMAEDYIRRTELHWGRARTSNSRAGSGVPVKWHPPPPNLHWALNLTGVGTMAARCCFWGVGGGSLSLAFQSHRETSGCNVWVRPCRNLGISKSTANCRFTLEVWWLISCSMLSCSVQGEHVLKADFQHSTSI